MELARLLSEEDVLAATRLKNRLNLDYSLPVTVRSPKIELDATFHFNQFASGRVGSYLSIPLTFRRAEAANVRRLAVVNVARLGKLGMHGGEVSTIASALGAKTEEGVEQKYLVKTIQTRMGSEILLISLDLREGSDSLENDVQGMITEFSEHLGLELFVAENGR